MHQSATEPPTPPPPRRGHPPVPLWPQRPKWLTCLCIVQTSPCLLPVAFSLIASCLFCYHETSVVGAGLWYHAIFLSKPISDNHSNFTSVYVQQVELPDKLLLRCCCQPNRGWTTASPHRLGYWQRANGHAGWTTEGDSAFNELSGSSPLSIRQQALRGIAKVALERGNKKEARHQYERILGKALIGRGPPAAHWAHSEYAWLLFEDGNLEVCPASCP